jgi:hypothetical protein
MSMEAARKTERSRLRDRTAGFNVRGSVERIQDGGPRLRIVSRGRPRMRTSKIVATTPLDRGRRK